MQAQGNPSPSLTRQNASSSLMGNMQGGGFAPPQTRPFPIATGQSPSAGGFSGFSGSNFKNQGGFASNPGVQQSGGSAFGQMTNFQTGSNSTAMSGQMSSPNKFTPFIYKEMNIDVRVNNLVAHQQFEGISAEELRLQQLKTNNPNTGFMSSPSTQPSTQMGSSFSRPTLTATPTFGGQSQTMTAGAPPPNQGMFAGKTQTAQAGLFSATSAPQAGLFGGAQAIQGGLPGGSQSYQGGLLGGSQAPQTGMFGGQGAQGTMFGGTQQPQGTMFGGQGTQGAMLGGQGTQGTMFGGQGTQGTMFGGQGTQGTMFGGTQQPQGTMFGGTQQPQGTMFGGTQQPQGTLFSGAQTTQAGGFTGQQGGLFGASQPTGAGALSGQSGQGLFGPQTGQAGTLGAQPAQGLFGASQPSQAGTLGAQSGQGLFGAAQPAQTGALPGQSGLFGNSQAGQGGLFGGAQPSQSGLFGAQSTLRPASGLFGAQSTVPGQPAQSLFGGNGQASFPGAQTGGGLFGNSQAPQGSQAGASLFGAPQSGTSLFGAPQTGGPLVGAAQTGQSLFGAPQTGQSLFGAPQTGQSLVGAPQSGQSLFGGGGQGATSLFGGGPTGQSLFGASQPSSSLFGGQTATPLGGQSLTNPSSSGLYGMARPAYDPSLAFKDPYGLGWLYPGEKLESLISTPSSYENRLSLEKILNKKQENMERWRNVTWKTDFRASKSTSQTKPEKSYVYPSETPTYVAPIKINYQSLPKLDLSRSLPKILPIKDRFEVYALFYNPHYNKIKVEISHKMEIKEIRYIICEKTAGDIKTTGLVFKNEILNDGETVESAGITPGAELIVVKHSSTENKLVPENLLPKLTRADYATEPTMQAIGRMNRKELASVPNFVIKNSHGRIEFEGETDLTGLDLDSIVMINPKEVIMYAEQERPPLGQGLNKPATIRLFNCFHRKEIDPQAFQDKIKRLCNKNKSQFISWNHKTGEWVFKVQHF